MTNALTLDDQPRHRAKPYYGWVIVIAAAFAMVATFPGRSIGRSLITEPLLLDLKLDRVAFGWITLWATLIGSTFSLACGPLIDRLGTRIVLTANTILLGIAVIAMSRAHSISGLAVTLTCTLGLGQSALSVVSMALVGKWFIRRIDTAMAVFAAIVSIGFIAAVVAIQLVVQHAGWRAAWSGIGWALLLGFSPLAAIFVRRTPESCGMVVDGGATLQTSRAQEPVHGATLAQAIRIPAFWAFVLSAATFNLIFSGVTLFAEQIVRERGFYDPGTFRAAQATLVCGGLLANFAGGYFARKHSHGRLMSLGMLLVTAALLILPLGKGVAALMSYASLMGIAGGVITVVFFACWAKAFGRAHLGRIQGAAQVTTVLASALGPYILAQGERQRGSIAATFQILAPIVALLAIFCWFVKVPIAAETAEK
jgi:MFS family permease